MRGQRPLKHPALLAGHHPRRELVRLEGSPTEAPPRCPAGVLPATAKQWRSLWRSRVSQGWDRASDLAVLTRYILLLDRWHRYDAVVRDLPMVKGSQGQVRPNPLAARMDAVEGQLRALEDQLGLTPAARLRLGISLVEARAVLAQYLDGQADDDQDGENPRELLREEAR